MFTYTKDIKDEEMKAVEHFVPSFEDWIDHAISHKIEQRVNAIVEEKTDRQPKKMAPVDKLSLIKGMDLESRVDRDAREEAERVKEAERMKEPGEIDK